MYADSSFIPFNLYFILKKSHFIETNKIPKK